jgi:hypothetical protein
MWKWSIKFADLEKPVVFSSSAILTFAAVSKLLAIAGGMRFLNVYDPIFLVPTRYLLFGVAAVELVCCWGLLRGRSSQGKGLVRMALSLGP